jgi:hypothetical protein
MDDDSGGEDERKRRRGNGDSVIVVFNCSENDDEKSPQPSEVLGLTVILVGDEKIAEKDDQRAECSNRALNKVEDEHLLLR